MTMRTPLSRVRGLGSARDGTHHFWHQRLTGLANVPLTIALVVIVLSLGDGYEASKDLVAHPLAAIVLLLLVLSGTYHMRLGMQVIIEDYVHNEGTKFLALIANTFFTIAIAVACVFAIFKISFGG